MEREKEKEKIYISGPISGREREDYETAFCRAQARLEALGFEVFNPLYNGLEPESPTHAHMRRDIEELLDCDRIYMLRQWAHSKGCMVELMVATSIGLPVMFEEPAVAYKFE